MDGNSQQANSEVRAASDRASPQCETPSASSRPLGSYDDLQKLCVAVGTVLAAAPNKKAKKPMIVLRIDFGPLGVKTTSAMVTDLYNPEALVGRQIVAVTGMPTKLIAGVKSEVLLLAATAAEGSVLIGPDRLVQNGTLIR